MSIKIRPNGKQICYNKSVYHEYDISDNIEAGIVLTGSEVKSLRIHNPNIMNAFVTIKNREMFLKQMDIPEIEFSRKKHEPKRERKLLIHKKELLKLSNKLVKGFTIVPLSAYFNRHGFVKLEIALAKGKKTYDKRREQREKDLKRENLREISKIS